MGLGTRLNGPAPLGSWPVPLPTPQNLETCSSSLWICPEPLPRLCLERVAVFFLRGCEVCTSALDQIGLGPRLGRRRSPSHKTTLKKCQRMETDLTGTPGTEAVAGRRTQAAGLQISGPPGRSLASSPLPEPGPQPHVHGEPRQPSGSPLMLTRARQIPMAAKSNQPHAVITLLAHEFSHSYRSPANTGASREKSPESPLCVSPGLVAGR